MTEEERKYLYSEIDKFDIKLPLIVNLYCVDYDGLIGKLSLINILYDKLLSRKILIRNEYGMLGNILYKYRDKIDLEILLYLLDKDIKNLNLDDYCDYDLDEIKLNLEYSDFPFVCLNTEIDFMGFDDLSKNKKIVLNALVKEDIHFKDIADYYDNDREIVMIALEQDGLNLEYVSDELKKTREVVMTAIINDGYSLQYVDKQFIKDKTIVSEAVKSNGYAINFVLDEYIDDIDFLWNLLVSNENNTFSNLSNEHFYKLKLEIERKYGVNDVRYIKLIDNEELYNRRRKVYY